MEMQNVTNLTIPEGNVRAIHDSTNRLIWGRLNYATKYAGDTVQDGTPTPDAPIPVQVVTGAQTVTIGDGVSSEDFPISLGSLELCKLGDYQDYIYKSGDDWYVHKSIYKYTFTGEEPWQLRNTTAEGVSTFSWTFVNMPVYAHIDAAVNASKCSYLDNHGRVTNINQMYYNFIGFAFYNRADAPNSSSFYANTKDADLPMFKSGVTGELLYYVLATATDTQITDSTLIGQLNAVHEWLTRYGYTSTVTGNLPIIIEQTNL